MWTRVILKFEFFCKIFWTILSSKFEAFGPLSLMKISKRGFVHLGLLKCPADNHVQYVSLELAATAWRRAWLGKL